jgi:hypothetical protein
MLLQTVLTIIGSLDQGRLRAAFFILTMRKIKQAIGIIFKVKVTV